MEVQFTPDLQARLEQLAIETGRPEREVVVDAMTGYFGELDQVQGMLDRRYDELKSGEVQLIDGEEAFERLRAKSEARNNERS
jgi:predicted DNA-binding protein